MIKQEPHLEYLEDDQSGITSTISQDVFPGSSLEIENFEDCQAQTDCGKSRAQSEVNRQKRVRKYDQALMNEAVSNPMNVTKVYPSAKHRREVVSKDEQNTNDTLDQRQECSEQEDEYDVYGKYVARNLRVLDKDSYNAAQKAINDILFQAAMGKLKPKSKNCTSTLSEDV